MCSTRALRSIRLHTPGESSLRHRSLEDRDTRRYGPVRRWSSAVVVSTRWVRSPPIRLSTILGGLLQAQSELETIKYPAAVWTGERKIVAGGVAVGSHDGALQYDPVADRWYGITEHSPVTIERQPDAAWTGREVLVVPRGFTDDPPAAFNPTTGRWRAFHDPPPSLAIDRPAAVWTGDELLLWGVSRDADQAGAHSAVGARLDIDTGEWSPMADSPLGAVDWWEGTPGSNSATWDAERRRMIVYTGAIGRGLGEETNENAATPMLAYYPDDDSWERLPSLPAAYHHPTLVIAGDRLIVASSSFNALEFSD